MSDGIDVNYDVIDGALARVLATSKRDAQVVMEETMRGVIRHVIGVTPPAYRFQNAAGAWIGAEGGEAKRHGEALVKADIRSVYGTPRDAYNEIAEKDVALAKGFWRHHRRHETSAASAIAKQVVGKGMYVFDGGRAHARLKHGRARGRAKSFLFFIDSDVPLKEYIREIQARVGWLAAGWNEAAAALGVKPAQWIWRHGAPGAVTIEVSENGIKIIATNAVSFASNAGDLQRRVQYALDEQAGAMNRRVDDFMKQKFRIPGVLLSP